MQSILLLVAPALFAASIYIVLGRIILLTNGEQYSLIRQKRLTLTFVCGDVVAFMTQSGGGGIQAIGTLSAVKIGIDIIIVGLLLQIIFFSLFVAVAATFHRRLVRYESQNAQLSSLPWKKYMYALYVASGLIMIRSVFRVIEFAMGNDGYLMRHEVFLYVFDAVLMLLVMLVFNFIHPSQITDLMKDGRSPVEKVDNKVQEVYV
jgi:RTA1 like protein